MNFIKWLSITDRHTRIYLDRHLAPLGLNSSQHMYIIKICQNPGITQDQFFTSFHINPSNITRSIATLEKNGFLRKEINASDKRTCCLYPTSKATSAYTKIIEITEQWTQLVLEELSPEEQTVFLTLLHRVGDATLTHALTEPK